jgi:hypothetical protein
MILFYNIIISIEFILFNNNNTIFKKYNHKTFSLNQIILLLLFIFYLFSLISIILFNLLNYFFINNKIIQKKETNFQNQL